MTAHARAAREIEPSPTTGSRPRSSSRNRARRTSPSDMA